MIWHLAECDIASVNPALRTITDNALEGVALHERSQRLEVLRLAGSRITNRSLQCLMKGYDEHGYEALPIILDILNCTGLDDEGLRPIMTIDQGERVNARADQRLPLFSLTGLRIQEAEFTMHVGEDPKTLTLEDTKRRTTYCNHDGLYLFGSGGDRFGSKNIATGGDDTATFKPEWQITTDSGKKEDQVAKVNQIQQPYREFDEKQKRKVVRRGAIELEPVGDGTTLLEFRFANDGAASNCTCDEGINLKVTCLPPPL